MKIAIAGWSGFIGRGLLAKLACNQRVSLSLLSKRGLRLSRDTKRNVEFLGDLVSTHGLNKWVSGADVVINLAYLWNEGVERNLIATRNLINVCLTTGVRRLIHVSTASVVGRSTTSWVDETTACRPVNEYGRTKLRVEREIIASQSNKKMDVVILRPTSVYGHGSGPLNKLCDDLLRRHKAVNYMKACLFGDRAMNLVHVDNVVSAIIFSALREEVFNGEIYLVSEDSEVENTYSNVLGVARRELGIEHPKMPTIKIHHAGLSMLLWAMRRNIIDPNCRFSSEKLKKDGFVFQRNFRDGLVDYFRWYRGAHMSEDGI